MPNIGYEDIAQTGTTWINPTYRVGDFPPPLPTTYWWYHWPTYYTAPPAVCPGCGRCNTCGRKDEDK